MPCALRGCRSAQFVDEKKNTCGGKYIPLFCLGKRNTFKRYGNFIQCWVHVLSRRSCRRLPEGLGGTSSTDWFACLSTHPYRCVALHKISRRTQSTLVHHVAHWTISKQSLKLFHVTLMQVFDEYANHGSLPLAPRFQVNWTGL